MLCIDSGPRQMAGGRPLTVLAKVVSGELHGQTDTSLVITDVTHDSRQAGPGRLYVAIVGERWDGHDFVGQAVDRGSPAICVNHRLGESVPQIVVEDTRMALGPLSSSVHGDPSSALKVVGITGTNGKTTVAHYLSSIGATAGISTGLIGTIHTRLDGQRIESVRTTPEASDFQRLLGEMRARGAELVAVEVSSHGLALGRVRATRFAVAAFTNLSQDHLDFHGNMTAYLAAKRSLFEDYEVGTAVINIDDPSGKEIAHRYRGDLVTVGHEGDVRTENRQSHQGTTSFELHTPWGASPVDAPLVGSFNVDNAVIAATSALACGVGFDDVVAGLGSLGGVPGRFEVVSGQDPILVIVDYAHTPDGISKVISTARGMNRRQVIALVGAGGDRDRGKRPLMGAAVSAADLVIITSDNPRTEDPGEIGNAVLGGVEPGTDVIYELDRAMAIQRAVDEATPGDVVLILGRGHEPYQEIGDTKLPFDDRRVARRALELRRMSADSGSGSGSIE